MAGSYRSASFDRDPVLWNQLHALIEARPHLTENNTMISNLHAGRTP